MSTRKSAGDDVEVAVEVTIPATLGTPAGASISADIATVDGIVDSILVDTGTTIPATLGSPAGADMSTDIATIDGIVDSILVDTGTTIPATLGSPAGADMSTDIAALQTDLDTLTTNQEGMRYWFEAPITAAANAGVTTVCTVATQKVMVESVTIESNGATTADLTSAAVACGAAQVNTIISAATAARANIAATDQSVSGSGYWSLDIGGTVAIDLQGTGATAVDFTVTVGYSPIVSGGTVS
jgi:hypothetical protein